MRAIGSVTIGVLLGLFVIRGLIASGGEGFLTLTCSIPGRALRRPTAWRLRLHIRRRCLSLSWTIARRCRRSHWRTSDFAWKRSGRGPRRALTMMMMLMWAAFIVGAAALLALTAAGAYYLIMRARIPYPQAADQLPRRAYSAPVKIFPARARRDKALAITRS